MRPPGGPWPPLSHLGVRRRGLSEAPAATPGRVVPPVRRAPGSGSPRPVTSLTRACAAAGGAGSRRRARRPPPSSRCRSAAAGESVGEPGLRAGAALCRRRGPRSCPRGCGCARGEHVVVGAAAHRGVPARPRPRSRAPRRTGHRPAPPRTPRAAAPQQRPSLLPYTPTSRVARSSNASSSPTSTQSPACTTTSAASTAHNDSGRSWARRGRWVSEGRDELEGASRSQQRDQVTWNGRHGFALSVPVSLPLQTDETGELGPGTFGHARGPGLLRPVSLRPAGPRRTPGSRPA